MNSRLMGMINGAISGGQVAGPIGAVVGGLASTNKGLNNLAKIGEAGAQFQPAMGGEVGGGIGGAAGEKASEVEGVEDQSPVSRAIAKRQQDPQMLIHQSLQALDDPSLPIDYETRMAAIEPLLRAKHGVV